MPRIVNMLQIDVPSTRRDDRLTCVASTTSVCPVQKDSINTYIIDIVYPFVSTKIMDRYVPAAERRPGEKFYLAKMEI